MWTESASALPRRRGDRTRGPRLGFGVPLLRRPKLVDEVAAVGLGLRGAGLQALGWRWGEGGPTMETAQTGMVVWVILNNTWENNVGKTYWGNHGLKCVVLWVMKLKKMN